MAMAGLDHKSLVKAMEKSGVTQQVLADELNLSLQYVCDMTKGRRTLKRRPDVVKRIAEILDVPTHWIQHREAS